MAWPPITIYDRRSLSNSFAIFVKSFWNTVYDSCDLEVNVQSVKGIFQRENTEGNSFLIQGVEDGETLVQGNLSFLITSFSNFSNSRRLVIILLNPPPLRNNPVNQTRAFGAPSNAYFPSPP
jgi:hypothetical protein